MQLDLFGKEIIPDVPDAVSKPAVHGPPTAHGRPLPAPSKGSKTGSTLGATPDKPPVKPAPPADIRSLTLKDGTTIRYTLVRSSRAKKVWLRIGPATGLVVVAPNGRALTDVLALIENKADWIKKHSIRIEQRASAKPALVDGSMVSYLGEPVRIRLQFGKTAVTAKLVEGELVISLRESDRNSLSEIVRWWYKNEARDYIEKRVGELSMGKMKGRVTIKDQKTRWGSCSTLGNLNFNYRLMMAPPRIIDYLIIHELVHLDHHNHSKRFWDGVEKRLPDYRDSEHWLKKHGRELVIP